MDPVGLVAVVLLFGGGAVAAISFSPIGRALAAKILGRAAPLLDDDDVTKELERLKTELAGVTSVGEELASMREQLAELAERVDFAERLLAQRREGQRLAPGRPEA